MSASTNADAFNAEVERLAKTMPADEIRVVQIKYASTALSKLVNRTPVGNPDLWKANTRIGDGVGALLNREANIRNARAARRGRGTDRAFQLSGYVGRDYLGGHARQNWQVTHDAPPTGIVPGIDESGRETRARGEAVIAETRPFTLTAIVNNVPYIERLEDGHSKQAPGGMLALTYAELVDSLPAGAP